MKKRLWILALGSVFLVLAAAPPAVAFDDGPPISITSPDEARTFVLATLKEHSLFWNKRSHQLYARLVFAEIDQDGGSANDDAHDFLLPGVTLDETKGIFFAKSAKGEVIPVAHLRKALFFSTIETLPNSVVRVLHSHGNVNVVLEAIRPDDPAMRTAGSPGGDPSDTQAVDIHQVLH
jgi:hypothetical protein